jgi:hypothetical protein
MSSISRLILVQPDDRASAALRYAFEREGIRVAALPSADHVADALAEPASLVVTGGRSKEEATALLAAIRAAVGGGPAPLPVLYVGNGIGRTQALAEGATEFVCQPVFVRDVVTVARLLTSRKPDAPASSAGELGAEFAMFYLLRAVVLLRRRGVLTVVRGLRRGELRFYDGEVTSAQAGGLHGLAALHQLLLWTAGRFELRPENVVRRQQIPLAPAEVLADCERFLSETRQVADRLSPAALYERDVARSRELGQPLPDPVDQVWGLFDGSRTLADVVEDSPFRMFETLRVANQLARLGLLRERSAPSPRDDRAAMPDGDRAALSIDEWLGGAGVRRGEVASAVDWASLAPQPAVELPSPPSLVPSTVAAGEISVPRLDPARRAAEPAVPAPVREGVEEVGAARLQSLFVDSAVLDGARTVPFERVVIGDPSSDDDATTDPMPKVAADAAASPPPAAPAEPAAPPSAAAGEIVVRVRPSDSAPPPVEPSAVVIADDVPATAVDASTETRRFDKVAIEPPTARGEPRYSEPRQSEPRQAKKADRSKKHKKIDQSKKHKKVDQSRKHKKLASGAAETTDKVARIADPAVAAEPPPPAAAKSEPATADRPPAPADPSAPPRRERARSKGELDQMIRSADHVFTADEEAFFAAGQEIGTQPPPPSDSFDDLDDGYEMPRSFWQRFLRKPGAPIKRKP